MLGLRNSLLKINKCKSASNSIRALSSEAKLEQQNVTYEEVRIPVPWGHIAGKWWGPQDKRPILVLHGWQDNCGSFDRLIPLLPNNVGYLAIDFPGHGYSSQIPPGMFYHFMNGPITIRLLKEHFKWPKCSIVGHSLGSIMAYTYGTLFPQNVDFLVCMDALNPLIFNKRIDMTVKSIEEFIKYNEQNTSLAEPPSYTFQEMEQILHKATRKSINVEYCKYILERNIAPSKTQSEKYYFARDARLKCGPLLGWTQEDCFEAARRVNFPIMFTMANGTEFRSQRPTVEESIKIIKQNVTTFEVHPLNGTHHVHLNDPVQVANLLSPFITKHNTEERTAGVGDIKCCNVVK